MFCFVTMIFASCTPNYGRNLDDRDYDLYDKIGFKSGSQPRDIARKNREGKLSNSGVRIVEDYYYRKPEVKRLPPPKKPPKRVLRVKYEPSSYSSIRLFVSIIATYISFRKMNSL